MIRRLVFLYAVLCLGFVSGVAQEAAQPESKAKLGEARALYMQLWTLRENPKFHEYGLSGASPAYKWHQRYQQFVEMEGGGFIKRNIAPTELYILAMDWVRHKGEETELSQFTTKNWDRAFGLRNGAEREQYHQTGEPGVLRAKSLVFDSYEKIKAYDATFDLPHEQGVAARSEIGDAGHITMFPGVRPATILEVEPVPTNPGLGALCIELSGEGADAQYWVMANKFFTRKYLLDYTKDLAAQSEHARIVKFLDLYQLSDDPVFSPYLPERESE